MDDERFTHVRSDRRFRRVPKNVRKIEVDSRFGKLLKNKNFKEKRRVDERGRSIDLAASENFKKLYDLDNESSNSEDSDSESEKTLNTSANNEKIAKKKIKKKNDKLKNKTSANSEDKNFEFKKKNSNDTSIKLKNKTSGSKSKKLAKNSNVSEKNLIKKERRFVLDPRFIQGSESDEEKSLSCEEENSEAANRTVKNSTSNKKAILEQDSRFNQESESKEDSSLCVEETSNAQEDSEKKSLENVQLLESQDSGFIHKSESEDETSSSHEDCSNLENKSSTSKNVDSGAFKNVELSCEAENSETVNKTMKNSTFNKEALLEQDSRFNQESESKEVSSLCDEETSNAQEDSEKISSENVKLLEKQDSGFIHKSESEDETSSSHVDCSNLENKSSTSKNVDSGDNEEESESEVEEESDDSDSEETDSEKSDSFDHEWEEQHEKAADTEEITRRLAICNMDWDRIRAVDLFAVFNSFKPPDTSILSVKVYPSEYGLQRMEEERLNGPPELIEKTLGPDEEDVDDKKGGKYHREKLRQYQMNRLKYYYAVVECDTSETANSLYEQLNGMEYESSSVRFDLRFVPDDMTFDHEPTSTAGSDCDLSEYKPRLFVTTALQQVKVGLTWDETDPHRRETLQKAFTEPNTIENDLQQYLASSSGESDDDGTGEDGFKASTKERIQKYRNLLETIEKEEMEEKEKKVQMEILCGDDTEEASTKDAIEKYNAMMRSIKKQETEKNEEKFDMEITWETGVKEKTENLVKERMGEKSITPFEEMQKKRREKQKLKKKENKNKMVQEENSGNSEFDSAEEDTEKSKITDELYLISDAKQIDKSDQKSSKGKKNKKKFKKKKKVQQAKSNDVEIDVNDPRFSAIYTSPLYNIDPSDPHFKSTPGNLAFIAEKQRRLKMQAESQGENPSKKFKTDL